MEYGKENNKFVFTKLDGLLSFNHMFVNVRFLGTLTRKYQDYDHDFIINLGNINLV
jgi:hypothetical protein